MASKPADVVIQSIRRDSGAIIVTATIDGDPNRFRFTMKAMMEIWSGAPPPPPFNPDARFLAIFGATRGRSEIIDLVRRWHRGESIELPVHLATTRRA